MSWRYRFASIGSINSQWLKIWLLHLNPEKCESIVISNKRSPPAAKYFLDNKLISCKKVVHYLGVLVDSHLNWNDHCKYVVAKATRSLNTSVIVYLIVLVQWSLSHINVLCDLLWNIPVLAVWLPHMAKKINILECVQLPAAHWAAGSRWGSNLT